MKLHAIALILIYMCFHMSICTGKRYGEFILKVVGVILKGFWISWGHPALTFAGAESVLDFFGLWDLPWMTLG